MRLNPMKISLRLFRPDDAGNLLALFRDSIRRVNCRDYNPVQIAAWSSDEIDSDLWAQRFAGRFVPVAEAHGVVAGFAELEADGHIDRFYVSADHQRLGVGKQLFNALLAEAKRAGLASLHVEASITARPFFESLGFTLLASQVVNCRGAELTNYRMEKILS